MGILNRVQAPTSLSDGRDLDGLPDPAHGQDAVLLGSE